MNYLENRMENELPILGEIYEHKSYVGQKCKIIAITNNRVVYEILIENGENTVNSYHKSKVWVFLKKKLNKRKLTKNDARCMRSIKTLLKALNSQIEAKEIEINKLLEE
jgi:hypothetical protein